MDWSSTICSRCKKKFENDWLLDDPFGLDVADEHIDNESLQEDQVDVELTETDESKDTVSSLNETIEQSKNIHILSPRQRP